MSGHIVAVITSRSVCLSKQCLSAIRNCQWSGANARCVCHAISKTEWLAKFRRIRHVVKCHIGYVSVFWLAKAILLLNLTLKASPSLRAIENHTSTLFLHKRNLITKLIGFEEHLEISRMVIPISLQKAQSGLKKVDRNEIKSLTWAGETQGPLTQFV
jgi:hypothetical protein